MQNTFFVSFVVFEKSTYYICGKRLNARLQVLYSEKNKQHQSLCKITLKVFSETKNKYCLTFNSITVKYK